MSAEIMYLLIDKFIMPLLKFAGVYVSEKGNLIPAGEDPGAVYNSEGKELRIVKTDEEFAQARKDECDIFNPFMINRHMTFVTHLVRNELEDLFSDDKKEESEEPETEKEEDEVKNTIGIARFDNPDGSFKITFMNVGLSPDVTREINLAIGEHYNPIFAMWLTCVDAVVKYQKKHPKYLENTDSILEELESGLKSWNMACKIKRGAGYQACEDGIDFDEGSFKVPEFADNSYVYEEELDDYLVSQAKEEEEEESEFSDEYDTEQRKFESTDEELEEDAYLEAKKEVAKQRETVAKDYVESMSDNISFD